MLYLCVWVGISAQEERSGFLRGIFASVGERVVSLRQSVFNVILLKETITGILLETLGPGLPFLGRVENGG